MQLMSDDEDSKFFMRSETFAALVVSQKVIRQNVNKN